MMNRAVLKPASYRRADARCCSPTASPPATVSACRWRCRRTASLRTGEVSGFTAHNEVYPDEKAAVVVLVNLDASPASIQIAGRIATGLFGPRRRTRHAAGTRAGPHHLRRAAEGPGGPLALHRQRERLFHRRRARRLRLRARAARAGGRSSSTPTSRCAAAWFRARSGSRRRADAPPDHVHHARRQVRAVSDCGDGVASAFRQT